MKSDFRRFAPLGLIVSGLAALVSFGLYIIQREWNLSLQISVGVIVVGLTSFVFLDPDRSRNLLSGRQVRYGSNAFVLSVAFIGILVVINYLVFQNAQDWKLRWDMTEDQEHTLAPESLDTLENLPETVFARAFFTSLNPGGAERAREMLSSYQFFGNGRFEFGFINPDENPIEAQRNNVTRDGTIVLEMNGSQEQVTLISEREITGGLIRLLNPNEKVLYFLTGHGERDFEGFGEAAIQQVVNTLEQKNYHREKLNLLSENSVPDDANVLIISGPQFPISPEEVALLSDFLDDGGAIIVMYEPSPLTKSSKSEDPLIDFLAESWGIGIGDDIIVDLSSNQPFIAVANQYADHEIIENIQGVVTLFPEARSVKDIKALDAINKVELVLTGEQSWAETDFDSIANNREIGPDEGQDVIGPVPLAVVAENNVTGAKMVVFGDSDFASNAYQNLYANLDLIVNAVDWATGEEDLINLTPRTNTQRFLLPPQRYVMGAIFLISVFVLPGLALVSGIGVWIQRRRRG